MFRRPFIVLCALPLLATGGCEKDTPEPEASESKKAEAEADPDKKDEAPAADGPKGDAQPAAGIGVEAAAMIQSATAAAAAAPHLEHDNILGHFMMGNAVESVKEIKEQVAPPAQAGFVDVEALKSLASMQMGERSMVAINIDLNEPFGCALVDTDVVEFPVACVVAYKGGTEALVKDMGAKDKVADAKGHVAAYTIEGETIYVDALGDDIALSNHPDLFAQAKDYLEANIVGRADKAIADFELMVYPNAAMKRYADEVEDLGKLFADMARETPSAPKDIKKTIEELDQFAVGLGLTPAGAHFSVATHAKPGSDLAKRFDTTYSGRMDVDFVSKLPMSTFAFAGMQTGEGILENDAWKQAVTSITDDIAKEFDMTPLEMRAKLEAFIEEESELYTNDIAMGMVYEPGTLGGLVLEVGKKTSGRDKWKAWSETFTVDSILPKEGQEAIQWSFGSSDTTVEGVEIDRWTIALTPEAMKEAGSDPDFERVRKMWPDLTLRVDRAELDDRVIFMVAPTESDTYMKSAILATRDGKTIADHTGWSKLGTGRSGLTALYAVDLAGGVDWLRPLLPPSDAADIPSPLGAGLDDLTLVMRHPAPGVVSGSFNMSQELIDQLRKLAEL
ncbi:MAG: hypothetical protein ACE37F_04035 [Nannocystaceae bacterium]|nr:hypothetical protein [bacterium]